MCSHLSDWPLQPPLLNFIIHLQQSPSNHTASTSLLSPQSAIPKERVTIKITAAHLSDNLKESANRKK